MALPVDLSEAICKLTQNIQLGVNPMKELIGISAFAILFGIADARAEVRITGNNILPVAITNVQYNTRQRYAQRNAQRYRRLGFRRSPYGGLVRRRGPYYQELGPAGRTGPLSPTIND